MLYMYPFVRLARIIINLFEKHAKFEKENATITECDISGSYFFFFFLFIYFAIAFVILSCLCSASSWSPAGKGLTSWLSCM